MDEQKEMSTIASIGVDNLRLGTGLRRFLSALRNWVLLLCVLVFSKQVCAANGSENHSSQVTSKKTQTSRAALVQFMVDATPRAAEVQLASTLTAHLSMIPVALHIYNLGEADYDADAKLLKATQISAQSNSVAVVWLRADGETVAVFAPDLGGGYRGIEARDLVVGTNDWCESIAVQVYSNVQALLPASPAIRAGSKKERSIDVRPVTQSRIPVVRVVSPGVLRMRSVSPPVWLGGLLAYAPYFPVVSNEVVHRAKLEILSGIKEVFFYGVTFDLGGSLKKQLYEEPVELRVQTVRLLSGLQLKKKRLILQGRLGVGFSVVRIAGINEKLEHSNSDENQFTPGLFLAGALGLEITDWMAVQAMSGMDIHADSLRYTLADETYVHFRKIAPFVSVGLSFRFILNKADND